MNVWSARKLVIDVLAPIAGLGLAVYLPLADKLTTEALPLIFGLFGLPLVSRPPTPTPAELPGGSQPAQEEA